MTDDPKFFAWLDGELPAAEAAEMERKVAADAELRSLAEQHRALQQMLNSAFAPVLAAPVPDRLKDAGTRSAEVIDLSQARERRRWSWGAQAAAIAASLALGLFAGSTLFAPSGSLRSDNGRLVASGSLERTLSTQLASAQQGGTRIGLTFRATDGHFCRSFTEGATAGLACHEGQQWRVRGLFSHEDGPATDYRMAAGQDPQLMEMIDSTIAGEPLDASAEKELVKRGWR